MCVSPDFYRKFVGLICLCWCANAVQAAVPDAYVSARRAMAREVVADAQQTSRYIGRDHFSAAVMRVMGEVPRHEFVPAKLQKLAYLNRPLPIGHGQTISQPYIVALMTDLLDLTPEMRVLEVGTGSGYQAAILSPLVKQVFTLEIIEPLAASARQRLIRLQFDNVQTRLGDGYFGWSTQAPFDAIVVTAAASHIPPPLVAQLRSGGRMVIPVGSSFTVQQLLLVEKDNSGEVTIRQILPVRFVPLTGDR